MQVYFVLCRVYPTLGVERGPALQHMWNTQEDFQMSRTLSWVLLTLTQEALHHYPCVDMWPHRQFGRVRRLPTGFFQTWDPSLSIHLDLMLVHIFRQQIHEFVGGLGIHTHSALSQGLRLLPNIFSTSCRRQSGSVWALGSESPGCVSWWHNLRAVTLVEAFKFLEA